ncbi:MAG: DUF3450 family protein [Planctomycetes bacterium]|nr:DUF3450 family protein [Planctomycetota bacterium]
MSTHSNAKPVTNQDPLQGERRRTNGITRVRPLSAALVLGAALWLLSSASTPLRQDAGALDASATRLAETRLAMGKWIETQQILSKERNEWQQAKEILLGRVELVQKEIATLEEKLREAESGVAQANQKRAELLAQKGLLDGAGAQLGAAVARMEGDCRRLFQVLPSPVQEKLQPLYQRIPEDAAKTRVSVAERFQNVLGIFNELNKANNELTVTYEVRTLADGKPSEVRALYVGLAQAYYVSARGEGGIGRPGESGWTWEPSRDVADEVSMALEILQGKHTPAFVPLPVRLQ